MKISDKKLKHMLGVARECYRLSLERGHDEEFNRKMFMAGFLHDIGYEFSTPEYNHADASADLLLALGVDDENIISAVKEHGHPQSKPTEEWLILNTADMTTDYEGFHVDVCERLNSIRNRYNPLSEQYTNAVKICVEVGLVKTRRAFHG